MDGGIMKKLLLLIAATLTFVSCSVDAQVFGETYPKLCTNGTVTKPCYSLSSDSDTGFYWIASGRIGITINGAMVGEFNSSGILGSGLTASKIVATDASK